MTCRSTNEAHINRPDEVSKGPGLERGDGVVGEVQGRQVGQVPEGGRRHRADVGVVMKSQDRLRPWKLSGEMYSRYGQLSTSRPRSADSLRKFWSSRAEMLRWRRRRVTRLRRYDRVWPDMDVRLHLSMVRSSRPVNPEKAL